jgi:hypothetical protein
VHDAAKFWPAVISVEDGQDHQLQFSRINTGEVGQLGSLGCSRSPACHRRVIRQNEIA